MIGYATISIYHKDAIPQQICFNSTDMIQVDSISSKNLLELL